MLTDIFTFISLAEGDLHTFTTWSDWVVSLLMSAFFVILFYIIRKIVKRKVFVIIYSILASGVFIAWIFSLYVLCYVFLAGIVILALSCFYANLSELRVYAANTLKKDFSTVFAHSKPEIQKIFDHDKFYEDINTAVIFFAQHKTGAIMTFERRVSLNDLIKNGTMINAPVSPELLETIFYEGTRLHDGAVVIRGNTILAAAVYYTPTSKALSGKFGSRHRAAIGVSEITDSVTVVVSEETGRISFAISGELTRVYPDKFIEQFRQLMEEDVFDEKNDSDVENVPDADSEEKDKN